jgi:hypothetical protein
MARVSLCALAIILMAALIATPQQRTSPPAAKGEPADDSSVIKVDVGLVNILASVRGKK